MRRARVFQLQFVIIAVAAATLLPVAMADAASHVIVLPGAHSAEGIAKGPGSTFYAGDLFGGDIFRGNVQTGTAERIIDAPDGRMAVGMKYDTASGLLFVAGGATGAGFVYRPSTGETVATFQFADPNTNPFINDVALTNAGAWFTNSSAPALYFVPIVGRSTGESSTLTVTGPAAVLNGQFNFNGIQASPDGRTLLVAHTGTGSVYTVDPDTGASARIEGVDVPNVDGILLRGRTLWAVRNFDNEVARFRLTGDLSSGSLEKVITDPSFEIPTTAAIFGDTLGVVQAKFDTGLPPTASEYDVVLVGA